MTTSKDMYRTRQLLLQCGILLRLLVPLFCEPIDNGVAGDPKVECTGEQVGIAFTTEKSFAGRVFVQGYASQKECVMTGTDRPPGLSLGFTQCGVQRSRQLNPPGMVLYTTVVISFHPIVITKIDRSYRISCHYMEASRSVTADLDVSMLSTAAMTAAPAMPECRYEILVGGPTGQAARYVRVGEQIYHKWTCDSKDNAYCMRVHSCSADDGQGLESYLVVDRDGCSTDRFVLQNLEYLTDLTAGQETQVFKFADKAALFFSCQIELLSKASESADCITARPNCSESPNSLLGSVTTSVAVGPGSSAGPTSAGPISAGPPSSTIPVSSAAPAPEASRDVRRRVVRDATGGMNSSSPGSDFDVVGDLDLLRQQLTVFDLDNTEAEQDLSWTADGQSQLDHQPPSSNFAADGASNAIRSAGFLSPICISPIGFGITVFGLISLFVVAFSTAMRYVVPAHRLAYDPRKVISPDCNMHTMPRYLPFRAQ